MARPQSMDRAKRQKKRVLIVGAGAAGELPWTVGSAEC